MCVCVCVCVCVFTCVFVVRVRQVYNPINLLIWLCMLCLSFFCRCHVFTVASRNVLIDALGRMMLCDFGLAREMRVGANGIPYYKHVTDCPLPYPMYVSAINFVCICYMLFEDVSCVCME